MHGEDAKIPAMARHPEPKPEIYTEKDLNDLRRHIAGMAPQSLLDFYKRAYEECRLVFESAAAADENPSSRPGLEGVVETEVTSRIRTTPTDKKVRLIRNPL